MTTYRKFTIGALLGTLLLSAYPLYMGVRVLVDFIRQGAIHVADYPKYIIPYTPLCVALVLAVAFLPLAMRTLRRFALPVLSAFALGVFFLTEFALENMTVLEGPVQTTIQNWQMFACYKTIRTKQTVVDMLMGDYSPAFKLHFYFIAVVLLLASLNVLVGFATMIKRRENGRKTALILQAASVGVFLCLCVFACFTAFFRTGDLRVSPVSALLMIVFFLMLGVTVGVYTGSFLYKRASPLSVGVPGAASMLAVLLMYGGELILLDGHLYRFGSGWFFRRLGWCPFAPVDIVVTLAAGLICALIMRRIAARHRGKEGRNAAS